jgi:hypothetical protein
MDDSMTEIEMRYHDQVTWLTNPEGLMVKRDRARTMYPWATVKSYTVIPRDVSRPRVPRVETLLFDDPRCVDGKIGLGPRVDGQGDMLYRLHTGGSTWSGFILGGIESGRTNVIRQCVVSALSTGTMTVFYMDGQDGASDPVLWARADWSVGPSGGFRMLGALEKAGAYRLKECRDNNLVGFPVSPESPGVLVVIDDLHGFTDLRGFCDRFGTGVGLWRKLGIGVLAADSDGSLRTFDGSDRFRSGLCAGNVVALRTDSPMAGKVVPGLKVNPVDLPRIPGYGVGVITDGDGTSSNVEFWNRFIPESQGDNPGWWSRPRPYLVDWFDRFPCPVLDTGTTQAMGV